MPSSSWRCDDDGDDTPRSSCRSRPRSSSGSLPLQRHVSAGALALLAALAEVGVWIQLVARYDFGHGGLQFAQQWNWFSDLHVSYHVGVYGFSVWLIGLTVVAMAAAIAYGFWAGRERMRAYWG